jgi:hypothetical protein
MMENREAVREYLSLYGRYMASRCWLPLVDMERMWALEVLLRGVK